MASTRELAALYSAFATDAGQKTGLLRPDGILVPGAVSVGASDINEDYSRITTVEVAILPPPPNSRRALEERIYPELRLERRRVAYSISTLPTDRELKERQGQQTPAELGLMDISGPTLLAAAQAHFDLATRPQPRTSAPIDWPIFGGVGFREPRAITDQEKAHRARVDHVNQRLKAVTPEAEVARAAIPHAKHLRGIAGDILGERKTPLGQYLQDKILATILPDSPKKGEVYERKTMWGSEVVRKR